jgi:hypothetical protein
MSTMSAWSLEVRGGTRRDGSERRVTSVKRRIGAPSRAEDDRPSGAQAADVIGGLRSA